MGICVEPGGGMGMGMGSFLESCNCSSIPVVVPVFSVFLFPIWTTDSALVVACGDYPLP